MQLLRAEIALANEAAEQAAAQREAEARKHERLLAERAQHERDIADLTQRIAAMPAFDEVYDDDNVSSWPESLYSPSDQ